MSRNLTAKTLHALYANETDKVFLSILIISHTDLETPIRVVNNTQNIISNGNNYLPFPFQIDLPNDNEGIVRNAKLTIDNIDRTITRTIRELKTSPTIELSMIMADNPDYIEIGPWQFKLQNASYDACVVTGDLIYEDILQFKVPGDLFTPDNFGGLF